MYSWPTGICFSKPASMRSCSGEPAHHEGEQRQRDEQQAPLAEYQCLDTRHGAKQGEAEWEASGTLQSL